MKKVLSNKKLVMVVMLVLFVLVLAGCQSYVDVDGTTKAEYIITLDTPWKKILDESFFSAIFVWPLAQAINWVGGIVKSPVVAVTIITLLYNLITMGLSVKSQVQAQKIQLIQPEMQRIQMKYEGRSDNNAKMAQAQELQQLYNKHGINPMSSLLTPILTLPIMIAMYYATQRAEVVCSGKFFGIALTNSPKTAFANFGAMWPLVVIFVLMAVLQFVSMSIPKWLSNASKKKDKNYREYKDVKQDGLQNVIMTYGMLAMIVWLGLTWPTSMSVYWAVSSIANILKSLYIQWRYID